MATNHASNNLREMHALASDACDPEFNQALLDAADEIERLHAETKRLSAGLLAINRAHADTPASVLSGIAYDIALNCMTEDVADYQIVRRTEIAANR